MFFFFNDTATTEIYTLSLHDALPISVVAYLEAGGGIAQIEVAGSYRRRRETIGDLDIVVTADGKDSAKVMDRFATYGEVAEVISKGETRATVKLRRGPQGGLRAGGPDPHAPARL